MDTLFRKIVFAASLIASSPVAASAEYPFTPVAQSGAQYTWVSGYSINNLGDVAFTAYKDHSFSVFKSDGGRTVTVAAELGRPQRSVAAGNQRLRPGRVLPL